MNRTVLTLLLAIAVAQITASANEPAYSVEDLTGIVRELSKDKYEQPIKDWLSKNRPDQFERLFGEEKEQPEDAEKEDGGLLSILAELSSAIADPQIAMLDYYINLKASAGWEVLSMTDRMIIFRRETKKPGEQDDGERPATRGELK